MKHLIAFCLLLLLLGCSNQQIDNLPIRTENTSTDPANADSPNASEYRNPVDGKTYVAPDGWTEYQPEGGIKQTTERIQNREVRLLTAEAEIFERTSVDSLAKFINQIEQSAQRTLSECEEATTVMVQLSCVPKKFTVELAHQGGVTDELLQNYYDDLSKLTPLPVSTGEIVFQVTIDIGENGR